MCFDICAINIRVSIRVRGLHLVFCLCCILPSGWGLSIQQYTVALVGCHGHVPTEAPFGANTHTHTNDVSCGDYMVAYEDFAHVGVACLVFSCGTIVH